MICNEKEFNDLIEQSEANTTISFVDSRNQHVDAIIKEDEKGKDLCIYSAMTEQYIVLKYEHLTIWEVKKVAYELKRELEG